MDQNWVPFDGWFLPQPILLLLSLLLRSLSSLSFLPKHPHPSLNTYWWLRGWALAIQWKTVRRPQETVYRGLLFHILSGSNWIHKTSLSPPHVCVHTHRVHFDTIVEFPLLLNSRGVGSDSGKGGGKHGNGPQKCWKHEFFAFPKHDITEAWPMTREVHQQATIGFSLLIIIHVG